MARVRLHPRAAADLDKLPPPVAEQVLAKLEMLEKFPYLGVSMTDAFEGFRSLLAARNRYRIVYRVVTDDLIEVAYVRLCRRQLHLRLVR